MTVNLRDFMTKVQEENGGALAVQENDKVDQQGGLWFIGTARESAKVSGIDFDKPNDVATMIMETIEFMKRRNKITICGLIVNPLNSDKLVKALEIIAEPDDTLNAANTEEEYVDDDAS